MTPANGKLNDIRWRFHVPANAPTKRKPISLPATFLLTSDLTVLGKFLKRSCIAFSSIEMFMCFEFEWYSPKFSIRNKFGSPRNCHDYKQNVRISHDTQSAQIAINLASADHGTQVQTQQTNEMKKMGIILVTAAEVSRGGVVGKWWTARLMNKMWNDVKSELNKCRT